MKLTRKILSILMIFTVIIAMPITALASSKTVSPLTGLTYTHADRFDGKKIHHGIDVSEHNANINWTEVKKTVDFAIIRVGYRGYGAKGTMAKDEYFDQNIKNAKAKGLKVGIYFYSQALNTTEAKEEANNAIKWLGSNNLDLPIFYDYEFADVSSGRLDSAWRNGTITKTKMTNNALAFMDTIKNAGYSTMIYCNQSFLYDHVDHATITKNGYGIWLANYNTKATFTGNYTLWQYSSTGKIGGITGNVDSNFWYGDFVTPTTTTTTTTTPQKKFTVEAIGNQPYTGSSIQPNAKVTYNSKALTAGSDYYITYSNNKSIGIATATIVGINAYAGFAKANVQFKIVPKKVSGLTVVSTNTNSTEVKWSKEATADKYRVQVYRSGAWKTYSTTSSTSMTITGLSSATTYNVRVCGYKTINNVEFAGPYCTQVKLTTTPIKPTSISASTGASSVTITWTKQANATGYQLYQYDYSKEKYVLLNDVQGSATNSYKHTSLNANKKYRYRVRAYKVAYDGKTIYGPYSDRLEAYTKPSATTLKSLSTPATKRIKASWSKVSGASGYQVQWSTYSDFSSNYKSVNVSGASTLSTTITTYQSKKKYYVRVRSYATHDGIKYYSSWSNKQYITTK